MSDFNKAVIVLLVMIFRKVCEVPGVHMTITEERNINAILQDLPD